MGTHPNSLANLELGRGFDKRSTEEVRSIARLGGVNSGISRNWKAEIKANIGKNWDKEITDPRMKATLRKAGLPTTYFGQWLYKVLQRSSVNPQILRIILELVDALNTQQNNITVNAVPIIIGGEDELK